MKTKIFLDTECYINYFLVCFKSDKVTKFYELHENSQLNRQEIKKILESYTTIGFNSKSYDLPMLSWAIDPKSNNKSLKELSDNIAGRSLELEQLWSIYKKLGISFVSKDWDHIDLFHVAPKIDSEQKVGLKVYGARFNTKILQELPIPIDAVIAQDQHEILRKYCENDVNVTKELYEITKPLIDLRVEIGKANNLDVRSSSDAQIAEKLVRKTFSIDRIQNKVCEPFKYTPASYFKFKSPEVNSWLQALVNEEFICDDRKYLEDGKKNGKIGTIVKPQNVTKKINIKDKVFSVAIGGMHSENKAEAYEIKNNEYILDVDFSSYYPAIMLTNNFYPRGIGEAFLPFYKNVYDQRITAKKNKDIVKAEAYKIILNGSFGKTASIWSCLYDPRTFLNITLTGQLNCFMLIEKLNEIGCEIISANTDGITFKGNRSELDNHKEIITSWSSEINLSIEMVEYKAIYHESVNSYIAIKNDNSVKCKGTFAGQSLSKNPAVPICVEAVLNKIRYDKPIRRTILEGKDDISKFIVTRVGKTGTYWKGNYLGKIARWYYGIDGEAITNKKGHKVATSDGAIPLMNLDEFTKPIDINIYVEKTYELLERVGVK